VQITIAWTLQEKELGGYQVGLSYGNQVPAPRKCKRKKKKCMYIEVFSNPGNDTIEWREMKSPRNKHV
jgi:hypothetical protein